MDKQFPATMKSGAWEYRLPRYMQHVLEVAGLDDGDYTIEEFIERINQIEYDPDRDGEISLFVNVAKLLFVEFAGTTESNDKIGLANVRKNPGRNFVDRAPRTKNRRLVRGPRT